MPSLVVGGAASGFTPLFSGSMFSGRSPEPVGGCQLYADLRNSGVVYVSLSGAYPISGQVCALPGSGGPTIMSGAMLLSGGMSSGLNDAFPLFPGTAYFIPKLAFAVSGVYTVCVGVDAAGSGQARIFSELF